MLKTSRSIKSIIRLRKGEVGVDANCGDNDSHDNGDGYSSDSDRNSSDMPKSMCFPALFILRLRMSILTDSLTSAA